LSTAPSLAGCTVSYFDAPGRGEAVRLALVVADVSFTDERVSFLEWRGKKPTLPFGSMPVLTLANGTVITQQRAILRFIGKQAGTYPTDPMAAFRADERMDAVEDLIQKTNFAGAGLEKDAKEAARKEAVETGAAAALLVVVDKHLEIFGYLSHPGSTFDGASVTVADLHCFATTNMIISGLYDGVPGTCLDSFKNIQALRAAVAKETRVAKFYSELAPELNEKLPPSYKALGL